MDQTVNSDSKIDVQKFLEKVDDSCRYDELLHLTHAYKNWQYLKRLIASDKSCFVDRKRCGIFDMLVLEEPEGEMISFNRENLELESMLDIDTEMRLAIAEIIDKILFRLDARIKAQMQENK